MYNERCHLRSYRRLGCNKKDKEEIIVSHLISFIYSKERGNIEYAEFNICKEEKNFG